MLKQASQFDVGASAKRRSNEPIASVRRSNEARQQRIAKFLDKPKNIDAVGIAIQRESLNGSVPISVLDKAIRETLPFQISRDELASTRAIFVLNEDLLQPGDGVYHLSERGQLWIESLRQRERGKCSSSFFGGSLRNANAAFDSSTNGSRPSDRRGLRPSNDSNHNSGHSSGFPSKEVKNVYWC